MADVNLSTTESLAVHATEGVAALAKATSTTLVEYLIANETIFPSGYDIAAVAGDGITMRERSLSDNWLAILGSNFSISGMVLPSTSLTLSLTVPLGEAFIAGRYLSIPATLLTFSPSITSYVFLKVTRDASLNVTGAYYEVNTTNTEPADAIKIGRVVSAVGSITSTVDLRYLGAVAPYRGPRTVGSGSTNAYEGSVTISVNQGLSGVHYHSSFTLNAGITATVAANSGYLCIVATNTITINGTLDGSAAGAAGGVGQLQGTPNDHDIYGMPGLTQPGGGGGGGSLGSSVNGGPGGGVVGVIRGGLAAVGAVAGGNGTQVSNFGVCLQFGGGGSGGGGGNSGSGGGNGGNGGAGGASILLIAPTIVLGASSAIKTSGGAGVAGSGGGNTGGGGGGGAGNYTALARVYTDSGCTFTLTGGAAGAAGNVGGAGGAGAAGLKQILIY